MNTGEVVNQLLQAISEFNADEALYWCKILLNRMEREKNIQVPVDQVITGFGLGDQDLSKALGEVLILIASREDFSVLVERYESVLLDGLNSSDPILQSICIRIVLEMGLASGQSVSEKLLLAALKELNSEHGGVSGRVIEALMKVENKKTIESLLLSLPRPTESVAQFRFLEALMIVGQSGESSVILKTFIDELRMLLSMPDDALLVANGLHTASECVQGRQQYLMLKENGIIDMIASFCTVEGGVIAARSVDFFAQCVLNGAFEVNDAQDLASILRSGLQTENLDYKSSVVFAICALASKNEFFEYAASMLPSIQHALIYEHSSVQIAALHGLGIIFKEMSSEKSNFLITFNSLLSEPLFTWLHNRALTNFEEQKNAAYFALNGLLSSPEGLKLALDTSSVLAELLNRDRDESLLGCKWKYGILETIAKRPDLFALLNEPLKAQVLRYLGQGVVFKAITTRVAFEPVN